MASIIDRLIRGAPTTASPSGASKFFTLVMVCAVTALALMDRNILNVLLIPIKTELGVSDTAMGLLTGTTFAVFYATAAIPVARMVDRGNRRNILTAAITIWSAATALCGFATAYVHLLFARIGVAAAESTANPAIMSMISDLYPANKRAMAVGATTMGLGIGVLCGGALGGYLAENFGWRAAFIAVGLPGLLAGLLMWLFVPEPVRGAHDGGLKEDPDSATAWRTIVYLFRIPSFSCIALAKTASQIATQAQLIWFVTYLVRVHGWSLTQAGLFHGMAIGFGVIVSSLAGGYVADRLAQRGPVWYLRVGAFSMFLAAPFAATLPFAATGAIAAALLAGWNLAATLNTNASMAAALAIVRPRMRGFMTAVVYLIYNLLGAGLGGFLIGLTNDLLAPTYGDHAIRFSLLLMAVGNVTAGILYLLGSRTIDKDVQRAQSV